MKKIGTFIIASAAMLSLTACQIQPRKKSTAQSAPTITRAKGHLISAKVIPENLTPKQNVAAITIYAAKKYGDVWEKAQDIAKDKGVNVALEDRSSVEGSYQGEGYIYQVGNEDTCYTLHGSGTGQVVYIYQGDKLLGSSTISDIVSYLNKHNPDSTFKEISSKVTIGADNTEDSNSDNSSKSTSGDNSNNVDSSDEARVKNLPGDAGLVTVPSNLQGTWYGDVNGKLEKVIFTKHCEMFNDDWNEFHKRTPDFDAEEYGRKHKIIKSTWHATLASPFTFKGISGLVTYGWYQIAGASSFCGYTTLKGQPVLINVSMAAGGLYSIFWKTPQLAKEHPGLKYPELKRFYGAYTNGK